MATTPLRQFRADDEVTTRLQQNTDDALRPLINSAIVSGALCKVTIPQALTAAADFVVTHNLGRIPTGILPNVPPYNALVTPGFGAQFVQSATVNPLPKTSVILICSNALRAGATLSFWIY